MQRGQLRVIYQAQNVSLFMNFQKCGGLREVAPHGVPDFHDTEVRLIANIP